MSGFGRITQAALELIGPNPGHGRVTQLYAEAIGPLGGSQARVTQAYLEILGSTKLLPKQARITMLYLEPIGPPATSGSGNARITQLYAEVLGAGVDERPCRLPAKFTFTGDVSGNFYDMESLGSESVPVPLADSYVNVGYSNNLDIAQFLTVPETWVEWHPLNGGLQIKFTNGEPVRTIWVVTTGARDNPIIVPIWASPRRFDLWKQGCIIGG